MLKTALRFYVPFPLKYFAYFQGQILFLKIADYRDLSTLL